MPRIWLLSLAVLFTPLIVGNSTDFTFALSAEDQVSYVSGLISQRVSDGNKELYVDKMTSSEIKDTENQKITVSLTCKNLLKEPEACVDIFFFSLIDSSGEEYQPKLVESKILAARIPGRDTVQGALSFVIPLEQNATKLIYTEDEDSAFLIDLLSTKEPADKPPVSEWKLVRNKGLTLSDSNIELKIYDESRIDDYYVLDISIRNTGSGIVNYHALYAYLKSASGFVFGAELYADVESKIESGTLDNGRMVRGKIAFDTGGESGPFMLIYDDIAGSYFATGQLVPQVSSEVKGKIIASPDDLINISKYNAYWDPSSSAYKIIGEISNESEQPVTEVQIAAKIHDQSGDLLYTRNHTLSGYILTTYVVLSPNASIPFFLEFNIASTAVKNIGSYELSLSYSFSEAKIPALDIKFAELVQASKPTPLSKYVLWQIKGELINTGQLRSTHTQLTASVYDSNYSIVGVGGFSVLDQQPRDLNPGQSRLFSIEVALPTTLKPSSFYVYAESDQFVGIESETETVVEIEPEQEQPVPLQPDNQTLIKIVSKQREDLLQIAIKNLPNSTSIYGIHVSVNETDMHTMKNKLRWNSEETSNNEVLLSTVSNSIRAGQEARFLFNVDNDVSTIFWRLLDGDGEVLLEGTVKPFQIRR